MSGRWRDRITGGRDEFSEKGHELSTEQREHLTRVTDELLQRYSISRSVGPGEASDAGGEPVSADEIGAVLESVLVEAFDFGWFTRSDLPEAPELALESEDADWEQASAAERSSNKVLEPVEWPDPRAEEEEVAPEWGLGLGAARAIDPQPESELIPEPEIEPAVDLESESVDVVVPEDVVEDLESESEDVVEDVAVPEDVVEDLVPEDVVEDLLPEDLVPEDVVEVLESESEDVVEDLVPEDGAEDVVVREDVDPIALAIEIAELEEIHRGAVQAERDAIMFAAATRQRLAEARQEMADLEAGAGSPRS